MAFGRGGSPEGGGLSEEQIQELRKTGKIKLGKWDPKARRIQEQVDAFLAQLEEEESGLHGNLRGPERGLIREEGKEERSWFSRGPRKKGRGK